MATTLPKRYNRDQVVEEITGMMNNLSAMVDECWNLQKILRSHPKSDLSRDEMDAVHEEVWKSRHAAEDVSWRLAHALAAAQGDTTYKQTDAMVIELRRQLKENRS